VGRASRTAPSWRHILASFYDVVGDTLVNDLIPPDRARAADGRVEFYVEEQGVYRWALDTTTPDRDDPPVVGSYNESGSGWTIQAPRVSLFRSQLLVVDVAIGRGFVSTDGPITRAEADDALTPLRPLPWPTWSWPPRYDDVPCGARCCRGPERRGRRHLLGVDRGALRHSQRPLAAPRECTRLDLDHLAHRAR
jgi:hypothetical protein